MSSLRGWASPMLPDARFHADVMLIAPREFEVTRAKRTYREKNFTSFTDLLKAGAFHTEHVQRIQESLGLEALSAYLRTADLKVSMINCNVSPHTIDDIYRKVAASKARVVGISLIYRPQVGFALELLQALAPLRDLKVVVGGALASYMPRELLSRLAALDAVVYGEAEETFRDYCLAALDGQDTSSLPGIAYRDGDTVVMNPAAAPLDLSRVQRPSRDTLEYLRATAWPTRIASLYTSRGCLAKCTFCTGKDAYDVERRMTYRYRDPVDVVDEIEFLHDAFGVRFVYINDDNFIGYGRKSRERITRFCDELLARRLDVQFAAECRVDGVDLAQLSMLKEAGMRQLLLGLESGSDAVLTRWRKGSTVEQNLHAVELCRKAGVTVEAGLILFDAETAPVELADNLAFIRKAKLDRMTIPTYLVNRLSVYPGTEVERLWTEQGILAPSPIPVQRTHCPSDRKFKELRRAGAIALQAPVRGQASFLDDPSAVIAYFQRLEYQCADPRSEIAWRGLRSGVEPVEMFLESELPGMMAILSECRGAHVAPALRDEVRGLVHKAARWRQGVGALILELLDAALESYRFDDLIPQLRWLRRTCGASVQAHERNTLGMSSAAFRERVLAIRRELRPLQVSVVIPTAGKWSRLRRSLHSLAKQRIPPGLGWEVILVCDGVEPAPELAAMKEHLPLRILALPSPRGRGGARNAGVIEAQGETVILLDDDMVVVPDFVISHLEAQTSRPALCHGPVRELPCLVYFDDLDSLSVTPGLAGQRAAERARKPARSVLDELRDVASCGERHGSVSPLEADGMDALRKGRGFGAWVAFAGANLSAPRKWFLSEPFDERPGQRWGLEDIALALDWLRKGRALSCAENALGLHLSHHRGNWRENLRENAGCLDFLTGSQIDTILDYLEQKTGIAEVEACLSTPRERTGTARASEVASLA